MVLNKARDFDISLDEVSITELPNSKEYATAVEALQVAQQEMQDDPRNQRTTRGKTSTPENMDAASYFTRSALRLTGTPSAPRLSPPLPLTRPPPEPPPATGEDSDLTIKIQTCSPLPIPLFKGRTTTTSPSPIRPPPEPPPSLIFSNPKC